MPIQIKSKHLKIGLHILLWSIVMFFVISGELDQLGEEPQLIDIVVYLYSFTLFAVVSYFNIFFLIPKFFLKKKYVSFFLFLIGAILLFSVINFAIKELILDVYFKDRISMPNENKNFIDFVFHISTSCVIMVLFTSFVYIIGQWIKSHEIAIKVKEFEKEKISAELEALKAQINPHFLFNILNILYSLSIEKSDKAPEVILKLSYLMSYILYDCQSEFVLLKKEVNFITNYLELEKFRFEDRISIKFDCNVKDSSVKIAPLLFIPFIENAFKHGKVSDKNEIKIILSQANDELYFSIENKTINEQMNNDSTKICIGIQNIKQRLQFLYLDKHKLSITDENNIFRVGLLINLT